MRQGLSRRHWLAAASTGAAALLGSPLAQAQGAEPSALERIRKRGRLIVGVYQDLPPFHMAGKGIEVDLAQALGRGLGLPAELLPFPAGENMDDDLRNVVWRGHYLGWGPADVMLHVPVDRALMQSNPRVAIFAPYWRERVMIARNLARLPALDTLEPLRGQPVAAAGQSLCGWLMLGADDGAYRDNLRTKIDDGVAAARLLQGGEVVAACGTTAELQSVLGSDTRFAITPLPMPRAPRDGWAVGMAVKKDATDLAQALRGALDQMSSSGELQASFARHGVRWQQP